MICLLLFSCQGKQEYSFTPGSSVMYAQGFSIEENEGYTVITIRYPGESYALQTLVLVPKSELLPADLPEGTLIRTPLENVVSFSAITCGMLDELGEISTITGLTEPEYVRIASLREGIKNGTIADLGLSFNPNVEKIMLLEPEAIFVNPMEGENSGFMQKLTFPVIQCLDFKEVYPLGQTEWIKVIGLLFGKEALADSLFDATCTRYNELKQLTEQVDNRPCVFTELKYGDFWYMPGGQSYIAHLLEDAGADYVWKEDKHSGTIHFSFEQVLDKAEYCDFWLIKRFDAEDMTYGQLKKENPNYELFDAYKNRNIFVCNTSKVPYYEELPLHPDRVLEDMIAIFHPELLPGYGLRYYKRVKN